MRDIAQHHLEDAERQLKAVALTIDLIRTDDDSQVVIHVSNEELLDELKTKKTQLAGLLAIARKNNGTLRTKEAKELLQRAGLMKQTKNASNILYNVITRSERFTQVAPGKYALIESSIGTLPIN